MNEPQHRADDAVEPAALEPQELDTPTQVAHPGRTTWRTVFQVGIPALIALGVIAPEIVRIVLEEAGTAMPNGVRLVLLAISAVIVAVAAVITRIMAIPGVNDFLRRHQLVRSLAAAPPPAAPVNESGGLQIE